MEHYSRDKVVLRILNTAFFALLVVANVKYVFFSGDVSLINNLDKNFFMHPYKFFYIVNVISLVYMLVFVLVQLDSSSHGVKKMVIENYSVFLTLTLLFLTLHMFLLGIKRYKLALLCMFVSICFMVVLYIKSQLLKKYMYNDEVGIYSNPISVFSSSNLDLFFITVNYVLTTFLSTSPKFSVALMIFELLVIIAISIAILIFLKDRIFVSIQILYLIAIAINTKLEGNFMPVGYLCFLSIVLISVFIYKTIKNKKVSL